MTESVAQTRELGYSAATPSPKAFDRALTAFRVLFLQLDEEGRVLEWSERAAAVLGVSREQAVGQPLEVLPVGWDVERVFTLAVAALERDGDPIQDLVPVECADGTQTVLEFSAVAEEEGGAVLLVGEDATARAHQQEQALQSRKLEAIGHLAAGIAHEINTPMQYISDNTLFVRDAIDRLFAALPSGESGTEIERLRTDVRDALEDTVHGIERVSSIVRAMKSFSHPSQSDHEEVDLNQVVETAGVVTRNEWKYVAELRFDLDPGAPRVRGNSGELHQVLVNLLVNASHAIHDADPSGSRRGYIHVRTRAVGDAVELVVADTGCGIPDSIRARIFEPFFTTKEIGRGTGQGLAMVHAIVRERHGGRIDVYSKVGEGTRFHLRLPKG
ncbi:MAG: ATP-binding protein [Planctomycetota bacterium]|nr:ATP-binding protein [Planctomycetota bacterium]MDA0934061.1 ATP-binding protein [Planctomycetota bacterium]MDA1220667.1 ATP-binding protein [Planctomycetota bacterium]